MPEEENAAGSKKKWILSPLLRKYVSPTCASVEESPVVKRVMGCVSSGKSCRSLWVSERSEVTVSGDRKFGMMRQPSLWNVSSWVSESPVEVVEVVIVIELVGPCGESRLRVVNESLEIAPIALEIVRNCGTYEVTSVVVGYSQRCGIASLIWV